MTEAHDIRARRIEQALRDRQPVELEAQFALHFIGWRVLIPFTDLAEAALEGNLAAVRWQPETRQIVLELHLVGTPFPILVHPTTTVKALP